MIAYMTGMQTNTQTEGTKEVNMNTYTKLSDGSWGVRTNEPVIPGQKITVTKKSGEIKTETIAAILSTSAAGNVVSIQPPPRPVGAQLWEPCERCGSEPSYATPCGHLCARHAVEPDGRR